MSDDKPIITDHRHRIMLDVDLSYLIDHNRDCIKICFVCKTELRTSHDEAIQHIKKHNDVDIIKALFARKGERY